MQTDYFTTCTDSCKIALCDKDKAKQTENDCPSSVPNCVKSTDDSTGSCSATIPTGGTTCASTKPAFTCTAPIGRFPGLKWHFYRVMSLFMPLWFKFFEIHKKT